MSELLSDVRYALRAVLRQPVIAAGVVLTLAIGVGLNGAVFSVVNALMYQRLPVHEPERLVLLGMTSPELQKPHELSWPDIEDQRRLPVYADVAAWTNQIVNLGGGQGGRPERAFFNETTANYFALLGVSAALGRTFAPGEDQGANAHRVIVLDWRFWQGHFRGDSSVIGRDVVVNGRSATIIGVAPESFRGVQALLDPQGYMPLNQINGGYADVMRQRDGGFLNVLARLAPGYTWQQARSASADLGARLAREYPATNAGTAIVVVPESRARPHLFIASYTPLVAGVFMVLSALVLLVACANIAGLLLSRAASRQRELAVRAALGAGRGRIARLLLIESLLMGLGGGVAALLVATWCAGALGAMRFAVDAPIRFDVQPDGRVVAFTLAIALGAGVLAGLVPALRGGSANLSDTLRAGTRSAGAIRQRLRSALVVAQVAVAVVVLTAAGMFVRSVQNAGAVRLGFNTDRVLLASVAPGDQGYDFARSHRFAEQLLERVAAIPGVRSAALARYTPLGYSSSGDRVIPESGMPDGSQNFPAFRNVVTANYFATMDIPLLEGRSFGPGDSAGAPLVAVVSKAFAAAVWPGGSVIGRKFRVTDDTTARTVVGVVANTIWMSLGEEPRPFLYYPAAQRAIGDFTLNIRTEADPRTIVSPVREAARQLDADLPLYDVRPMREHLDGGLAFFSLHAGATFAGIFGVLALLLGAVGLFGLIAFGVAQRTREIGVRLALGARASGVRNMVVRSGLTLVGLGLLIGFPLALLVGRGMRGLLIGTSPADPVALGGSVALLIVVAGLAAWLPARRAAAVDPMIALRSE